MDILISMKSNVSYKRIISSYERINFSENILDKDDFIQGVLSDTYDLYIIDEKLWWNSEANEILKNRNLNFIIFNGDFEVISNKINGLIPEDVHETEEIKLNNNNQPFNNINVRIIEKEKIIEKKVQVYNKIYTSLDSKLVGVANLSPSAGATFITVNIAKIISDYNLLVSIIDLPYRPYIFDYINLGYHFEMQDETYTSYQHLINRGEKIKDKENLYNNISWLVTQTNKDKIDSWSYVNMQKLIYSTKKSSVNLIDLGTDYLKDDLQDFMYDLDMLLVIIDPMPPNLMACENNLIYFKSLLKEGLNVKFLINKFNPGVNKKQLLDYLKLDHLIYVSLIDQELIYKAVYESQIPSEINQINDILKKDLSIVIKDLIPDFLSNNTKKVKNNFLKRRFK
ncbi:MAG: hypothetical protein AB7V16_11440 [Vulcanibacillus sp.]